MTRMCSGRAQRRVRPLSKLWQRVTKRYMLPVEQAAAVALRCTLA